MIFLFYIFFELSEINAFIESSTGDIWGIYKIKRAEELLKKGNFYVKKDLVDVLESPLSDSVKGKAIEILMFLGPDTLQNALISLQYLLDLHFYKKRKDKLWALQNFFKKKKDYKFCEKVLRKIASDYPEERVNAQKEIFEIFLKTKNFEGIYPLLDIIKKERPDLYLFYLSELKDTISFLFNYDTLKNINNFPYSDSIFKIYKNFLTFNDTFINDPDTENLKMWQEEFFIKKNKRKSDSLRKYIFENYGYILPLFPDSSYIPKILTNIFENRKLDWKEIYDKGLYDIIYKYAGNKNKYFLPSLYFLSFIDKEINFPDTLRGDSLFISLISFKKNKKGINYVPSKYNYLKGRFYFMKDKKDSSIYFLRFSKFYKDISLLLYLLSQKKDTFKIDSLLKKYDLNKILEFKRGREALLTYYHLKREKENIIKLYKYFKKYDADILKRYYKIFVPYIIENKSFKELFKLSLFLDDDTLKLKALLHLESFNMAEYYFKKRKIDNKFVIEKFFNFYAEKGNVEDLNKLKNIISRKEEFKDQKKWFDSVFVIYKKAIDLIKNQKYKEADSLLNIFKNDPYLKKRITFEKANISFVTGKLQEAKKMYSFLYKKYRDEFSLYNLTIVLRKLSHDSTLHFYKVYSDITKGKSDFYQAVKRLAYLYMDYGDYNKAKELLDLIYGLSPDSFEEKELKFFYMQILRALLDFEKSMREGFIIYLNYPEDKLFTKTALEESIELAKILKFDYKKLIKNKK
ncbi:MAG: hypothetical protein ABIN73_04635 [candidate division WOR-3 bacterium]